MRRCANAGWSSGTEAKSANAVDDFVSGDLKNPGAESFFGVTPKGCMPSTYDEQDTLHDIGRTQVPTQLRRKFGVNKRKQEIV